MSRAATVRCLTCMFRKAASKYRLPQSLITRSVKSRPQCTVQRLHPHHRLVDASSHLEHQTKYESCLLLTFSRQSSWPCINNNKQQQKGEIIKKKTHEKSVCTIKTFKPLGFSHFLGCKAYFWTEHFLQRWSEADSLSSVLHLPRALSMLNKYERKTMIKLKLKSHATLWEFLLLKFEIAG